MTANDHPNEAPFGRYLLHELIGEGGMGQVYQAFDTVTERIVALKVLRQHLAADRGYRERFRREAHAVAGLREPHVVPIHDCGEIDGRLYLDMRLIEGTDVKTLLGRDGPMSAAAAVSIIDQASAALDAAHEGGLVHRDVKPSNLIVGARNFVYLIDFGIARTAGESGINSTGAMIGTFAYMAPERFTTGQTDGRSDIYSLACVLFECLTGEQPYPGDSLEQQIAAHLTIPPPRVSGHRPEVPAGFDDVIARGMAKNPDDRYPTAGDLAADAQDALADTRHGLNSRSAPTITATRREVDEAIATTPSASAPTPSRRRWNRTARIGAALGMIAAAILGYLAYSVYSEPSISEPANTATTESTALQETSPATSSLPATSSPVPTESVPTRTTPYAVLGEYCSTPEASGITVDGVTAHCSRLQYTDAFMWSTTQGVIPNPSITIETPSPTSKQVVTLGNPCDRYGDTAVTSSGATAYCKSDGADGVVWGLSLGSSPSEANNPAKAGQSCSDPTANTVDASGRTLFCRPTQSGGPKVLLWQYLG